MESFGDNESVILGHISKNSSMSQRELARVAGISLGLINVVVRKLIKTGFIKVVHLNKRKVEYLLTPQGLTEAARVTLHFANTTIKNYRNLESSFSKLLQSLHNSGYDYFSVHGDGELRNLLVSIFQSTLQEAPVTLGKQHSEQPRAIVLNLTTDSLHPDFKGNTINVLEKIGWDRGMRD